ncbi:MAG TPA: amidohydrolase [Candidatus Bilamarchaeum sp.]|nr:amidohydrolase [Candidatus Bilamarchaeum sp.]
MLEICGGFAITDRGIEKDVSIAVDRDRIADIGKTSEMRKRYKFTDTLGGPDMVLSPSFIDTHLHSYQIGTRGLATGSSLLDWLKRYIWKFEGSLTKEKAKACAQLAYLEMVKSGVTTFVDYTSVRHTEEAFMVAEWFGLRGLIGKTMMDRNSPPELKEDTDHCLRETERLVRKYGKSPGLARPVIAPRFCMTSSDSLLAGCRELSEKYGTLITTHAHENKDELKTDRKEHGVGAIRHLSSLGLLGQKTLLAHCVHLSQIDLELLARTKTSVSHCPGSNMMLSSGIADVPAMLGKKLSVGLGSDMGAYCNLSMFDQMRLSVLAQKVRTGEPDPLHPHDAFNMATCGGAAAVGLGADIGTLAVGRKADILLLDSRATRFAPRNDLITQVVLSAGASCVDSVVCNGKVLLESRQIMFADEKKILSESNEILGQGF